MGEGQALLCHGGGSALAWVQQSSTLAVNQKHQVTP